MPHPGLLHPEPLPLRQATADPSLCRKHSNTVPSQSLWDFWVLVQTSMFEPSEWVWGLILNMILPLLLSFLGFSFALGHGVAFFFGGIQHSPVDGCSVYSAILQ